MSPTASSSSRSSSRSAPPTDGAVIQPPLRGGGRRAKRDGWGRVAVRRSLPHPPLRGDPPPDRGGFLWTLTDAVLANPDRRLCDQFALCARRHGLCADFRRLRRAQSVARRADGGGGGRRLGG